MEKAYLQEYMNLQFLTNVEDDNDHKKLSQASGLVQEFLDKNPEYIVPFSLAAFDPATSESDPSILQVQGIIINKWPTFLTKASKNNDSPNNYMRAVMIDALSKTQKDEDHAAVIWKSTQDSIKHFSLDREAPILTELLAEIANAVEITAEADWSILEKVELAGFPDLKIKRPEGEISVDVAITNIDSSVNKHYVNLKKQLEVIAGDVLSKSKSLDMRTRLLWWRQCRYSESMKASYNGMNLTTRLFCMAKDYANMIPNLSPVSVDYFLLESFREVQKDAGEEITFAEMIAIVSQEKVVLRTILNLSKFEVNGRKSLGTFLARLVNENAAEGDLFAETGIRPEQKISWGSLLLWLFHSIQLEKQIDLLKN